MLNAVADSTIAHNDREVVVLVGGPVLLDWLLGHVSAHDGSAPRAAALRAVTNLLSDSACRVVAECSEHRVHHQPTITNASLFFAVYWSMHVYAWWMHMPCCSTTTPLHTAGTASALLGRPGAVPMLLQAVNHPDDDAHALADALLAAIPSATLPLVALLEDVQPTLDLVRVFGPLLC